jgi:hypothetical protein
MELSELISEIDNAIEPAKNDDILLLLNNIYENLKFLNWKYPRDLTIHQLLTMVEFARLEYVRRVRPR